MNRYPDINWNGRRIKKLRTKLGETQETFAIRIGCSRVSLWQYESGKLQPRDVYVIKALQLAEQECNGS